MPKNGIIFETFGSVNEMKVGESNGLKTLSGVFGVCGVRNNNHRVYEKSNYGKMVQEMQARIKENGAIPGELEHPSTMNITLENISHKITDIQIDEQGVVSGTIQLLNTPKGKIAQSIVEGGLPLFISSRAMGQVDKDGNVTLERLATLDLVGSPGFSQARLHLNESQVLESLGDNTCFITEKSNQNTEDEMDAAVLERIEKMEAEITTLREANAALESKIKELNLVTIAEAVQNWIVKEYTPGVEKWIAEHFAPAHKNEIMTETRQMIVKQVGPRIQQWVVEEFAPEIEKWVTEQYSPEVEKWVINNVAPGIQNWMMEHFAPEIEKWVTENYSKDVKDMIEEGLSQSKESGLESIKSTLSLLESIDPAKPKYQGRQINENRADEPFYVANMPEAFRPKYELASKAVKESIDRRAKIFDFNNEGALERFWESVNFEEPKNQQVVEGVRPLNTIEDAAERQIRESLRSFRRNRGF